MNDPYAENDYIAQDMSLKDQVIRLEGMLYDMTSRNDWRESGYGRESYNSLVWRVEQRRGGERSIEKILEDLELPEPTDIYPAPDRYWYVSFAKPLAAGEIQKLMNYGFKVDRYAHNSRYGLGLHKEDK